MTYNLCVYGSLKKGQYNHSLLKSSKYLGECAIPPGYGLYVFGLPFLVKDDKGPGCYGEIYEVSKETLNDLDVLEGHPSIYKRELLDVVELDTGHKLKCWCYIYQGRTGEDYVRRF
jgi:gamma-glutamylaminecyclotransferase